MRVKAVVSRHEDYPGYAVDVHGEQLAALGEGGGVFTQADARVNPGDVRWISANLETMVAIGLDQVCRELNVHPSRVGTVTVEVDGGLLVDRLARILNAEVRVTGR